MPPGKGGIPLLVFAVLLLLFGIGIPHGLGGKLPCCDMLAHGFGGVLPVAAVFLLFVDEFDADADGLLVPAPPPLLLLLLLLFVLLALLPHGLGMAVPAAPSFDEDGDAGVVAPEELLLLAE